MTSLELQQKPKFITDTNHFNTLSNEIINNILHFLVPYEIVKLSQTNQRFRYFITDKENLLSLYKKFKKIDSFWKLFPHLDAPIDAPIETPIETPITTHTFNLKTFMILSIFQNSIIIFINKKNATTKIICNKGIQMGYSTNEMSNLFNTLTDKQIVDVFNLKFYNIDYSIFYENSYLTNLQIELVIKLMQSKIFDEYSPIYNVANLTSDKIKIGIKFNKANFISFIIYCYEIFTNENIAKINRLVENGFEECCAMNIVHPIILTPGEQTENLIKLKNCNIDLHDYDNDNVNTYILSYYAAKLTSEQIDIVVEYNYIDDIFHYAKIFTPQQWQQYNMLPGTLCEQLSLYVAQYFTDLQIASIKKLISANFNHNWCVFYVENLNVEQIENILLLFKKNEFINTIVDTYTKYRFAYTIVIRFTTEHILYFLKIE